MFSKPKDKAKKTEPAVKNDPAAPAQAAQGETSAKVEAEASPGPALAAPAGKPATETAAPAGASQPSPEALELAALKDRYARMMADFDNYRKRQTREREEWLKRANEDLLGDLLPVVDHLDLALKKTADPSDPFATGVKMVYDQFFSLLDRYGVTPIDAKGKVFDPAFHEALTQMSSPTVPAHTVIDQFRRGWLLAGRLLRPAQVVVSSGAPDPAQTTGDADSVSD